jgi:hypothetical protein
MSPLITWLGGRRFFLTLGCGISCTVLRGIERLDDATFGLVILGTVGAYIAGNTYQKVKGAQEG